MHSELTSLLRSALFGETPDAALFRDCDWRKLFALAAEQTVTAIALDGVERLPADVRPPRAILLRYLPVILQTEALNQRLNKRVGEICQELSADGFHPLVVKGQTVSRDYPQPLHRTAGDIDLWIADEQEANRIAQWAEEKHGAQWPTGEKEVMFTWRDVVVDIHTRITDMQHRPFQKAMHALLLEGARSPRHIEIDGADITTLPVSLAALHLIAHIEGHLLNWGCGLRQFCDLAVFLHSHREELADGTLAAALRPCGLADIAPAIGWVLHESLGLPTSDIPFDISPKGADIIVDDIWTGGNFGHKRLAATAHLGTLRRKMVMFPAQWRQYCRYRHLLPREAWAHFCLRFYRQIRQAQDFCKQKND